MIQAQITIVLETNQTSLDDIINLLELQLPYMADNVIVTSEAAPTKGEE